MTRGILGYGTYVPHHRLTRAAIAAGTGSPAGKGTRAVASFDEDTTSMAVEAGRLAIEHVDADGLDALLLTTPRPAYAEKTNATAVHAALRLPASVLAFDAAGSVRSTMGALLQALRGGGTSLVLGADVRFGLAESPDERDGGDGAGGVVIGDGDEVIAECLATASATDEFVHRWRLPQQDAVSVWEERFGEHVFRPLVELATTDVLKAAGLAPSEIDRVVVTGTHPRAVSRAVAGLGLPPDRVADGLLASIGNTGAAHPLLLLGAELDASPPGTNILVVVLSDGVDAAVLRTTDAIDARRASRPTLAQVAAGRDDLAYGAYLTWRGLLRREPPRRPEPTQPAAPPSHRANDWKFGLAGSRCTACSTLHLPPKEVCRDCGSVRSMEAAPMAGARGRVTTYTIDRLAYSLAPPVVSAVIDFDGGGRIDCELTDVDPAAVRVGMPVEMTFRRLYTAGPLHNYFWKARPAWEESA